MIELNPIYFIKKLIANSKMKRTFASIIPVLLTSLCLQLPAQTSS